MFEQIEELDQYYDCILLHVFTNNLRNGTPPAQCVEICDEYISALSSHCKFAKIILSLPFLTITEQELNNTIVESNTLFQYKYLNKSNVTVCNNSVLSNGNVPIRNGHHLTYQGTIVFVTYIKFHMKKVLHIGVTRPKQNGIRSGQRPNVNKSNKSKQTFPKNYDLQHNWDTIIQKYQQSPFSHVPMGPKF